VQKVANTPNKGLIAPESEVKLKYLPTSLPQPPSKSLKRDICHRGFLTSTFESMATG
jgi:hypothetical protein